MIDLKQSPRPLRVYLASSWRNPEQPAAVLALRTAGHEVYDFRHPEPGDSGFSWSEIDPAWKDWTAAQLREALSSGPAERGFTLDKRALDWCDVCVMLQPCGRSAALELGYCAGAGKYALVVLAEGQEPELMIKVADICLSVDEAIDRISIARLKLNERANVPDLISEIVALRAERDAVWDAIPHAKPHQRSGLSLAATVKDLADSWDAAMARWTKAESDLAAALKAKEEAETERDLARSTSIGRERQRTEAEARADAAERREGALRAALLAASTDMAQDSMEDAAGALADESRGYRRIYMRTVGQIRKALDGGK